MQFSRITIIFGVLYFAVASANAQSPSVQVTPQPGAPLEVLKGDCKETADGLNCTATVKVLGPSPITAYGLKWRFVKSNGTSVTLSHTADRGVRPTDVPLQTGQSDDIESVAYFKFKPGELSHAEVAVELVVPAIGRVWGNATSPAYFRMLGFRNGYRQALTMMKNIQAKQGTEALLRELGIQ
jgi:hypothetical protein